MFSISRKPDGCKSVVTSLNGDCFRQLGRRSDFSQQQHAIIVSDSEFFTRDSVLVTRANYDAALLL